MRVMYKQKTEEKVAFSFVGKINTFVAAAAFKKKDDFVTFFCTDDFVLTLLRPIGYLNA